eukprot:scaffold73518_cov44-Phaeocystis_antarctica.AAC.1
MALLTMARLREEVEPHRQHACAQHVGAHVPLDALPQQRLAQVRLQHLRRRARDAATARAMRVVASQPEHGRAVEELDAFALRAAGRLEDPEAARTHQGRHRRPRCARRSRRSRRARCARRACRACRSGCGGLLQPLCEGQEVARQDPAGEGEGPQLGERQVQRAQRVAEAVLSGSGSGLGSGSQSDSRSQLKVGGEHLAREGDTVNLLAAR